VSAIQSKRPALLERFRSSVCGRREMCIDTRLARLKAIVSERSIRTRELDRQPNLILISHVHVHDRGLECAQQCTISIFIDGAQISMMMSRSIGVHAWGFARFESFEAVSRQTKVEGCRGIRAQRSMLIFKTRGCVDGSVQACDARCRLERSYRCKPDYRHAAAMTALWFSYRLVDRTQRARVMQPCTTCKSSGAARLVRWRLRRRATRAVAPQLEPAYALRG
jgi:hypothetical protein